MGDVLLRSRSGNKPDARDVRTVQVFIFPWQSSHEKADYCDPNFTRPQQHFSIRTSIFGAEDHLKISASNVLN